MTGISKQTSDAPESRWLMQTGVSRPPNGPWSAERRTIDAPEGAYMKYAGRLIHVTDFERFFGRYKHVCR
ncbi:hypothetical protein BVG16_04390 [Paenibacillus selenitireducens]|uniref:Uncharacterized protein n=1 Tax=Paenibacillus selenitireducens TaxID=1324314 RepID=A0A1T2XJK8_9BACL|nr:hypothetical protein BVG16_04390 [Paenibacillus selenitireducens]